MINEISDELNKLFDDVLTEVIDEVKRELEDFGSPEKLLGKPFKQWSEQDHMVLGQIYGNDPDNPLSKLIFKKRYQEVLEMEQGL